MKQESRLLRKQAAIDNEKLALKFLNEIKSKVNSSNITSFLEDVSYSGSLGGTSVDKVIFADKLMGCCGYRKDVMNVGTTINTLKILGVNSIEDWIKKNISSASSLFDRAKSFISDDVSTNQINSAKYAIKQFMYDKKDQVEQGFHNCLPAILKHMLINGFKKAGLSANVIFKPDKVVEYMSVFFNPKDDTGKININSAMYFMKFFINSDKYKALYPMLTQKQLDEIYSPQLQQALQQYFPYSKPELDRWLNYFKQGRENHLRKLQYKKMSSN